MTSSHPSGSRRKGRLFLFIGVPLVFVVLLLSYVRWGLVLHMTTGGSDSMAPSYPPGSSVAYRPAFDDKGLTRGRVVVASFPGEKGILLQRLAGLPGETLRISSEALEVDGRAIPWRELGTVDSSGIEPSGPFTVPAGRYFLIGDNMKNAYDSRLRGTFPRASILGIVEPER